MAVLTTTRQKRDAWIEWLDHCRSGTFVNQTFFGKTIGGIPAPLAPAIVALELALRAGGYTPRSAWSYNFRGIAGATCTCSNFGRCSLHGNGIAIDIDPRLNPFIRTSTFRWSDTAFTSSTIKLIEGMLNTEGEELWFWGGRWSSIKDYMHFEANVGPDAADVDWTTVPGNEEEDVKRPLKSWAKPTFQWMINNGFYTEKTVLDEVRETYDFQQMAVMQRRMHASAIKAGSAGSPKHASKRSPPSTNASRCSRERGINSR